MSDSINEWVENAKSFESSITSASSAVKVVRKPPQKSRGVLIMEMAERLRPRLSKFFEGMRDGNDMLIQPAHVRAFALNMAHSLIKVDEQDNKASA